MFQGLLVLWLNGTKPPRHSSAECVSWKTLRDFPESWTDTLTRRSREIENDIKYNILNFSVSKKQHDKKHIVKLSSAQENKLLHYCKTSLLRHFFCSILNFRQYNSINKQWGIFLQLLTTRCQCVQSGSWRKLENSTLGSFSSWLGRGYTETFNKQTHFSHSNNEFHYNK